MATKAKGRNQLATVQEDLQRLSAILGAVSGGTAGSVQQGAPRAQITQSDMAWAGVAPGGGGGGKYPQQTGMTPEPEVAPTPQPTGTPGLPSNAEELIAWLGGTSGQPSATRQPGATHGAQGTGQGLSIQYEPSPQVQALGSALNGTGILGWLANLLGQAVNLSPTPGGQAMADLLQPPYGPSQQQQGVSQTAAPYSVFSGMPVGPTRNPSQPYTPIEEVFARPQTPPATEEQPQPAQGEFQGGGTQGGGGGAAKEEQVGTGTDTGPRGQYSGYTDAEWRRITAATGREMGLDEAEAWVVAFAREHNAFPWQVGPFGSGNDPSSGFSNMIDHLLAKNESEQQVANYGPYSKNVAEGNFTAGPMGVVPEFWGDSFYNRYNTQPGFQGYVSSWPLLVAAGEQINPVAGYLPRFDTGGGGGGAGAGTNSQSAQALIRFINNIVSGKFSY